MTGKGAGAGLLVLSLLACGGVPAQPRVVASILPLHSLAAAVMEGVGSPHLLVRAARSPHDYQMRPSDAAALAHADVVLWVGPALESFLARPLEGLASTARIVTLLETDGLIVHPARAGGVWADAHEEAGEHDPGPDARTSDPHLWLDPRNARRIAGVLEQVLAAADPAHATDYRRNAAALAARIEAADRRFAARLSAVGHRPYLVFHDGYQYLERRYGLAGAGAVTLGPSRLPGAGRLAALRAQITAAGVVCVFGEPQFEARLLPAVVEGTGARVAMLDPLGAALEPGPGAWFAIMESNVEALAACLAG